MSSQLDHTGFYQRLNLKDRSVQRYERDMLSSTVKKQQKLRMQNKQLQRPAYQLNSEKHLKHTRALMEKRIVELSNGESPQRTPRAPSISSPSPATKHARHQVFRSPTKLASKKAAWQPDVSDQTAFGFDIKNPKMKLADKSSCVVCGSSNNKWQTSDLLTQTHEEKIVQL
jgi:hypothetical protein